MERSGARELTHTPGGDDAGERADPRIKRRVLLHTMRRVISRLRQVQLERHRARRIESEIDLANTAQTLAQQPRTHQEDECECDLRDNEPVAPTELRASTGRSTSRPA